MFWQWGMGTSMQQLWVSVTGQKWEVRGFTGWRCGGGAPSCKRLNPLPAGDPDRFMTQQMKCWSRMFGGAGSSGVDTSACVCCLRIFTVWHVRTLFFVRLCELCQHRISVCYRTLAPSVVAGSTRNNLSEQLTTDFIFNYFIKETTSVLCLNLQVPALHPVHCFNAGLIQSVSR